MSENGACCNIQPYRKGKNDDLCTDLAKVFCVFLFMCMGVFPAYMSVHHMPAVPRNTRRGSDLPELKLQMVVGHYVNAWERIPVLYKSSECSQLLSHLFSQDSSVNNLPIIKNSCFFSIVWNS